MIDIPYDPPHKIFTEIDRPRRDVWRRLALAVIEIAVTGHSTWLELTEALAGQLAIEPDNGSLKKLLGHYLPHYGLAVSEVYHTVGVNRELGVIRLTDRGKDLARMLGVKSIESDLERLIRLHQGEQSKPHTALVLRFVALVRQWGNRVWVLPDIDDPYFVPDVLINFASPPPYSPWAFVEIEGGSHRYAKWKHQARYQGFTAFCAKTPAGRHTLKWECSSDSPGMATDLETLIKLNHQGYRGPLWQEHWPGIGSTVLSAANHRQARRDVFKAWRS